VSEHLREPDYNPTPTTEYFQRAHIESLEAQLTEARRLLEWWMLIEATDDEDDELSQQTRAFLGEES